MAANCYSVVRGKRVRVTRLDECGTPPAAMTTNALVTSSCFISVQYTLEYEDGDEHIQKNANGDLCINDKSCDQFKRVMVVISFCEVDPDLFSLLTSNSVEVDAAGNDVGFRVSENTACSNFALELWSGLDDVECDVSGNLEYGYFLLPFVTNGTLRDFTVENGPTTFEINGWTKSSTGWGTGPYNVVRSGAADTPSALEDPITDEDHLLVRVTTVAPPAAVCGYQAMPAAPTPAVS
jgi:hypothetical protein